MTTPEAKPRYEWVDAGRGLAIFLVVMFHGAQWLREAGLSVDGWLLINDTLPSLRMPLFFVMAGLFAQKWMTLPWARVWSGKLSLFVWVYAIWSVLATLTFMLGLHMQGILGNPLRQIANLVVVPVLPRFELWFIWALAIFFVVARLIRRVPSGVQLTATGVLSAVALTWFPTWFPSGNSGWFGLGRYFFFFLVGLLLRDAILRASVRLPTMTLAAGFALWAVAAVAGTVLGLNSAVPGYYFVTCLLGLVAGLAISKSLSGWRALRRLGAQTLPVYVTHTSIILGLAWLLSRVSDSLSAPLWGWVVVPAVALSAVLGSLALAAWVATRRPWRYLYQTPEWLSHPGLLATAPPRHLRQ